MTVMACGHSSRGTGSITDEFQAGVSTAVQQPQTNTRKSTDAGPPQPPSTRMASKAHATTCASKAPEIRRRRSVVSASTPAGSASRNIGRNTAVCTSAARNDEPLSSTMSQAAAMVCMPLPMKKTPPQSQSPRKAGWRRGLQMEWEADIGPLFPTPACPDLRDEYHLGWVIRQRRPVTPLRPVSHHPSWTTGWRAPHCGSARRSRRFPARPWRRRSR